LAFIIRIKISLAQTDNSGVRGNGMSRHHLMKAIVLATLKLRTS